MTGLSGKVSRSAKTVRQALRIALAGALSGAVLLTPHALRSQEPGGFSGDPVALVRRATQNELPKPGELFGPEPMRYKLRKADDRGITTKEIVESKDGGVARLIARNDQPLTPEQQQAELNRLQYLMDHPEVQEHRRKREQEDSNRVYKMVRILPDAFLYTYAGMVNGPSGPAVRLTFKPNPAFEPPDRESQVYAGMEGELWIDRAQGRLARLDAHLVSDVEFGWGILGRLYKGGSILVENADVGGHRWETTHMKLNLVGKALMVKTIRFQMVEDASDFLPVPRQIGYRDAIRMLEAGSRPAGQIAGR